jgi:hypothetical protein
MAGSAARFRALLPRARTVQRQQLTSLLRHNAGTQYGRRYGFAAIDSYAAFREQVPVVSYDDIRSDIDRVAAGVPRVLTADDPIAFEQTGGSSGGAKLVPYTPAALDAFRRALLPWLDDLATHHPRAAHGKSYWAISPATRAQGATPSGISIGLASDAAYFGDTLAPLLPEMLAVPPDVGAVQDVNAWRDVTCAHLLACESLALISVWSPTFLLDLLDHLQRRPDTLIARAHVTDARAAVVRRSLDASAPDYRQLWPRLTLVSCWDQASSAGYADALRARLPGVTVQGKGLLATEGVVSIPLHGLGMPVLAVESGFYEFRDDHGHCYEGADLTPGAHYEVLMTTWGGLYRYAIGDKVRVHGYAGEAPLLEFIGRGALTCDLCGEKLNEAFVLHALQPLRLQFALLLPAQRGYVLVVDAHEVAAEHTLVLAQQADHALCANPQYAYARALGQLQSLQVRRSSAPLARWQAHTLKQGRRLADLKLPALSQSIDLIDIFCDA